MKKTTVDGNIVALAIDRDHGGMLVATHSPDALIASTSLRSCATWTVKLDGTPVAVAAAGVDRGRRRRHQPLERRRQDCGQIRDDPPVGRWSLTASDEGAVLHVAEASGIEVFDATRHPQRTLELTGDRAPRCRWPRFREGRRSSSARERAVPRPRPSDRVGRPSARRNRRRLPRSWTPPASW